MISFYENFLSLCAKSGKTPSGVAASIGLSNAAASGWKKGKQPSEVTLRKLSQYFGVSVSELTGEEQKNKPTADYSDGQASKFMELFSRLSPEEQAREIAYLRERLASQDK